MGVATGCGFKEIDRFPHTTYPYSSCICTFWQQHPYFFFILLKYNIILVDILKIDKLIPTKYVIFQSAISA